MLSHSLNACLAFKMHLPETIWALFLASMSHALTKFLWFVTECSEQSIFEIYQIWLIIAHSLFIMNIHVPLSIIMSSMIENYNAMEFDGSYLKIITRNRNPFPKKIVTLSEYSNLIMRERGRIREMITHRKPFLFGVVFYWTASVLSRLAPGSNTWIKTNANVFFGMLTQKKQPFFKCLFHQAT